MCVLFVAKSNPPKLKESCRKNQLLTKWDENIRI